MPEPKSWRSTRATRKPLAAKARADTAPLIPPPTTRTSKIPSSIVSMASARRPRGWLGMPGTPPLYLLGPPQRDPDADSGRLVSGRARIRVLPKMVPNTIRPSPSMFTPPPKVLNRLSPTTQWPRD